MFGLNPWLILVVVVAFVGSNLYSHHSGVGDGIAEQKVADQGEFDTINKKLADQKTAANALYRAKQDENVALMAERDKLKNQIGDLDVKKRAEIAALAAKYSSFRLSFKPKPGDGGCRPSGGGAVSTPANPASNESSEVVQLPDEIAGNLRQLTRDADDLNADYAKCYKYANEVK